MLRRQIIVIIAGLMTFSFLFAPTSLVDDVDAFYQTKFTNDSTEKTITFLGSGTDETTSVTVEKGSHLTYATLTVKGEPDNSGNYPLNVSVDVGGDGNKEWKYQGIGYGSLGRQWQFNDSADQKTIAFGPGGTNTDCSILLPKNAHVTASTIDINRGNAMYFFQPGTPGKDSQVYINSPGSNYATYNRLMTNYGSNTRGFVEFDISSLPASAAVTSATMYFFHHQNANSGQSLELREVLEAWSETTITWNNQPSVDVTQLDTCMMSAQGEWLDFDVTQIVYDWHTSVKPNYGVRISGLNGNYNSAYIMSSDCTNPYSGFGNCWPKLEVLSSIAPANPTMDIGNDGDVELSHSGELQSVMTSPDLSLELNSHIQSLSVDYTDDYGNDFVKVPIKFSSSTPGSTLSVTNISITYTLEAEITVNPDSGDLLTEFNKYIPEGDGDVSISIHVKSQSAGKVTLGNLNLTYDAKPLFQPEIPNLDLPEDTHSPTLYDISSHFSDDFDTPSDLSYEVIYDDIEMKGVCLVQVLGTSLDVDATRVPNWNSEDFPNSSYIALKVKATDTNDRSVESNQFLITVNPQNDEPIPNLAQPLFDLTLSEEGLTSLDLTAEPYFYDIEGDILSYSVEVDPMDTYDGENITAVMDHNGNIMTIEGGQDYHGEGIPVWIFCDDDPDVNTTANGPGNYVYREVLVDVEPVNDEPVWYEMPTLNVFEDEPREDLLNLYDYVYDIETPSNELEYTIERNTAGTFVKVEIDPNGNIDVISLAQDYFGSTELEILASDDEDEASGLLTIIVEPVNDDPTVSFMEPRHDSVVSGVIAIRGNANDLENALDSVEIRMDNGEWVLVDGLTVWTYQLDTTMYENGPHTIDVRSYDGELYSSVESVSVQIQNEPPVPPIITISYPEEGTELKGSVQVQGTTTGTSAPVTNVSIRTGLERPWVNALGTQLWNFTLDTTQYPDGPLTIYVRAYDGLLFSEVVTRTMTVNNTEIEYEPPPEETTNGKSSESDAFPWWLVILIIVIVMVVLIAFFLIKRKRDSEKRDEKAASVAKVPAKPAASQFKIASPVTPAPVYSTQETQMYGGYGQQSFSLATSPYQQPQETPRLQAQGGADQPLYLTSGATTGYGSQQAQPSGTSLYQEQAETPLLPPAAPTTVACFSCGGSVPVTPGATIVTCPNCGTQGQL